MTDDQKPKKARKRKTPVAGTNVTEPGARDSELSIDTGPVDKVDESGAADMSASNAEQVKLDSEVGTSVPEPTTPGADTSVPEPGAVVAETSVPGPAVDTPEPGAVDAAPQAVGTALTMPHEAVPMAVERTNVSAVQMPMEIGKTSPLELPARAPADTSVGSVAKEPPDTTATASQPTAKSDTTATAAAPELPTATPAPSTRASTPDTTAGATATARTPDVHPAAEAATKSATPETAAEAATKSATPGPTADAATKSATPGPTADAATKSATPGPTADAATKSATPGPTAETATSAEPSPTPTETATKPEPPPPPPLWSAPIDPNPSPDFMLADELLPPVAAPPPAPPVLPSPQEAALEAARIVSQMVDIDSESGAVIAAAAAAGAAIEAAVAAQKAQAAAASNEASGLSGPTATPGAGGPDDPRSSQPGMRIPPSLTDLAGQQQQPGDPVTTVRLSRDRILQALAQEDLSGAAAGQPAPIDPNRIRARTEPGIDPNADDGYEEFDPVAIAAAAIGRLRQRARTDLAELRVHYHRHDILVLLLAFVIIAIMGRVHRGLVTPPNQTFSEHGLTFQHSTAWLKPEVLPMVAPRLVRDPSGSAPTKDESLYHVELSAIGSNAKIEVLVDKKPAWSNIVTGLELDRRSRWGELYSLDASSVRSIAGHDWLRTAYRYAHSGEKGDIPRVDRAVEYATIDRDQIYVITLFGTPQEIDQVEDVLAPSLRVQSQTGLPLVPQTGRLAQHKYPSGVGRAFDSTVMVVVADLIDGRLKARGGGSGVVVGADGSILTNYHVLHDKDGRLHDTFVIGRFASLEQAPQLQCAGRPNRSKLLRDLDLALIKCDMDLDGRTWSPAQGGVWPTLPEARVSDIKMGQRLWVLGYPDVGGGGLTLSVGEVEGWTGEDGTAGKDFIKTDASITHGNSGGPVIDDNGKLVGIAAAFRTKVTATGGVIETAQVGLVRPLQSASNLLAYAAAGWTPREGYTDVELTPTAVEAAAEGVRIYTTVLDDANEAPIRDATVMVLKAGVNTATIDMNRLDDQAISWGKTNALGEVRLKQLVPVPGTYTVMVVAPGYEPLIGENELHLDEKTPPSYDPWGKIGLRSR